MPQAAALVAARFEIKARDEPGLEEVGLGLWEGLTRDDLRFRFPTVYPQWEEEPLAVNPPDGEPLPDAIARLSEALAQVRRRARGAATALALRPMARPDRPGPAPQGKAASRRRPLAPVDGGGDD